MEQTLLQLRILKATMTIGWASHMTNGLYIAHHSNPHALLFYFLFL